MPERMVWLRRKNTSYWKEESRLEPVELLSSQLGYINDDNNQEYEPMPITERFYSDHADKLKPIPMIPLDEHYSVELEFSPEKSQDTGDVFEIWIYFNNALLKRCRFIHELQNIFYDILDRELEIEHVFKD